MSVDEENNRNYKYLVLSIIRPQKGQTNKRQLLTCCSLVDFVDARHNQSYYRMLIFLQAIMLGVVGRVRCDKLELGAEYYFR